MTIVHGSIIILNNIIDHYAVRLCSVCFEDIHTGWAIYLYMTACGDIKINCVEIHVHGIPRLCIWLLADVLVRPGDPPGELSIIPRPLKCAWLLLRSTSCASCTAINHYDSVCNKVTYMLLYIHSIIYLLAYHILMSQVRGGSSYLHISRDIEVGVTVQRVYR